MDKVTSLDFDLLVEPSSAGSRVRVLYSPAGEAAVEGSSLPGFTGEMESASSSSASDLTRLQDFGARLFSAVFQGEVLALLRRSQDAASRQGGYLRLRLRFGGSSEMADLPWELMYDPSEAGFLALRGSLSVSRCLEVARPLQSQEDQPPLRLLAVIAGPSDLPPLDTEAEWQGMQASLAKPIENGLIVLERLDPPTPLALQRRLRQGSFHIVHLVGHGSFDERAQDGLIYLENEKGYAEPVSSQRLADLLSVERGSLRLVTLNACESAGFSTSGPFSGLAPALVRIGVPSVIAQRAAVPDRAASVLASELYAALAAGLPVDLALGECRRAMYNAGYPVEWALPVLNMRSGFDGRMFRVQEESRQVAEKKSAPSKRVIHTGGGAYVEGRVSAGGDFVGRDQYKTSGPSPVEEPPLKKVYAAVVAHPGLSGPDKDDLKADLEDLEGALSVGGAAGEQDIARRLRSIGRTAPDILDLLLPILIDPRSGLGIDARRAAEKAQLSRRPPE